LIEEARFGLLSALQFGLRNPLLTAPRVVTAATTGGARCLGHEGEIGVLRDGYQADLIVVGLDGAHQVPVYDPVTALIFASSGRDVLLTIIAGREVYRDRRVLTVDEDRLKARLNEIAKRL
jgi:5-methylthioadenosine/S-adenosylhomocysteine deaminase